MKRSQRTLSAMIMASLVALAIVWSVDSAQGERIGSDCMCETDDESGQLITSRGDVGPPPLREVGAPRPFEGQLLGAVDHPHPAGAEIPEGRVSGVGAVHRQSLSGSTRPTVGPYREDAAGAPLATSG